jgi:hypothetical protein
MAKTADEALAELVALKVKLAADLWATLEDDEKEFVVAATAIKVLFDDAEMDVAKKIFELARADGLGVPEL